MAPFIKFTEKVVGKETTTTYWRYVNAAVISQAKYDTGNKTLRLTLNESKPEQVDLSGEEAQAALEILQKL